MSGFGIDASTARKATEANTQTHGRQLCTPGVFASEASRTARWEACSPIEPDQRGWIDVLQALIAATERPGLTLKGPGARRAHKGIATTADHIWIARNRGKFIPIARVDWTQPVLLGDPAMTPDSKTKKGRIMLTKLLGAAAMAASALAFVPAHAAHVHHARVHHAVHVGVGCSGDNFAKAEGGGVGHGLDPAKFMAEREIAQAQDAMLSGQMSGCAMHLGQALRDESGAQTPYPETMAPVPFASTAAQAPAETMQGPPQQPQFNWAPLKGAY